MALSDCIVPEVRETIDPTLSAGSVTFTGITLTEGGLKIPAIQATWAPIANPYVIRVQIRYQEVGLASGMIPSASVQKESLSWLSTMGIVGGKSYIVQQRAVAESAYGLWSVPATVAVPAAFVAGDTTHVGGVPAVDVVTGLSTNAAELAKQILLDQNFRSYQEALNYDGEGNSTQFIALSSVEQSETAIQLLELLGAVNGEGNAYVLSASTAVAGSGTNMGQLLSLVSSSLGDGSITVAMLQEAINGQEGRIALSVNGNGQVVGLDLGIDGPSAYFDMVSPNFRFIDPLGAGGPLTVLSYSSDRSRWEFTSDVYAQKIFANAIFTLNVVDGAISDSLARNRSASTSGTGSYVTLWTESFTLPYDARVRCALDVNFIDGGGNGPSYHESGIQIYVNSVLLNKNENSGVTATQYMGVGGFVDVTAGAIVIEYKARTKPDDSYDRGNAYTDWQYK